MTIGSSSKDVFERARQPEVRPSPFICLDVYKSVLLNSFSPVKTIYPRVSTKPLPNDAKSPLPVDVCRPKTVLFKLPNNGCFVPERNPKI